MCFYYQLSAKAQDLENRYKRIFSKETSFKEKTWVNGFEFPKMPIIIKETKEIQFFKWGLIPYWAKDDSIKKYTLNARIETLSEKPSFKSSLQHRCLVPATGFYEWKWLDIKGKQKQKYLIKVAENELFTFAGLFSEWIDQSTGEIHNTYTIVTTAGNDLMTEIHNTKKRMPVILNPDDEKAWLDGENYNRFAFPYETELKAILI